MVSSVLKFLMLFLAGILWIHTFFPPWRKSEKMIIIHNIEGYDIWLLPPVGYVPTYPNSISRKNNHVRLIFNLGSTAIIHSNSSSSSILLIEFTGSLLLLWDHSFPTPSSAAILAGFSWGNINTVRKNCKVGGHHCLPKSTTGKSLRTADLTLVVS